MTISIFILQQFIHSMNYTKIDPALSAREYWIKPIIVSSEFLSISLFFILP